MVDVEHNDGWQHDHGFEEVESPFVGQEISAMPLGELDHAIDGAYLWFDPSG